MKLFLFIIILISINTIYAQKCVYFNRSQYISPCDVYAPSSVGYIGVNDPPLEEQLNYTNNFIQGLKNFPAFPSCNKWLDSWFCINPSQLNGKYPLQNCATDVFGIALNPPTIIPTCKSMCQRYRVDCIDSFIAIGIEAAFPPTFCDQFNDTGIMVGNTYVPCWNITPSDSPPVLNNQTCPHYTIQVISPDTGNTCQPRCPSPEYTDSQLTSLGLLQQIVSWISFVTASILVILYVSAHSLRKFPTRIILFLLIATLPLSLAFMLVTFSGGSVQGVWCGNTQSYPATAINGVGGTDVRAIATGSLCIFQAWLIVYGTLSVTFWWAVLCINTAMLIYNSHNFKFKTNMAVKKIEISYHIICWLIPLILTIIPTASHKMDYEATATYCFISTANNYAWQIACWFVPMGLALVSGTIGILFCIFYMIKNITFSELSSTKLSQIIRMSICLFIFLTAVIIIFASQILNSSELANNNKYLITYLICLLGGGIEETCRAAFNNYSSINTQLELAMTASFFMCVMGFLLTIFFGTGSQIINIIKSRSHSSSSSKINSSKTNSNSIELASSITNQ